MPDNGCVLIVDDDPAVRDMLSEYLSSHGYEVQQADDGSAMRSEIERNPPDVVLLDVRLPGEDGLSLARYLRERYDVGIIMVTAAGEVIDRVVGLEIGADDYVTKPFDPRELLARLKSVMRRMQAKAAEETTNAEPQQRIPVGRCHLDIGSHQDLRRTSQQSPDARSDPHTDA
jgi:DNA-binding response OmpR family regulator